jgi:hypothetical protein
MHRDRRMRQCRRAAPALAPGGGEGSPLRRFSRQDRRRLSPGRRARSGLLGADAALIPGKERGARAPLRAPLTPLKEPLPAPLAHERMGLSPPPAASGRDAAFVRCLPCDRLGQTRTPIASHRSPTGKRHSEERASDPAPPHRLGRRRCVTQRPGQAWRHPPRHDPRCYAPAASPGEPASAAGCTLDLGDLSPSTHRQMDRRLLIGEACALASHAQMIAESPLPTSIFIAPNEDFCA